MIRPMPVAALAALLFSCPVLAERAADIDTIVVTANRTPMLAAEALVPVTVITREEIARSLAIDVIDLLRFEAGLDVARTGGPGQSAAVFIRGAESNHALVLVDGVRVNPGTIGGAPLQHLAPSLIERIEIVKGARSTLYGTDAIGGVINIITRGSRQRTETAARGGSFDTRQLQLSLGQALGDTALGMDLDWSRTDGFPTFRDDDVERGYDNFSANLTAAAPVGAGDLTLRHWQASGTTEYSDFFRIPVAQDYRNSVSALEFASPMGRFGDSRVILSYLLDEIEQKESSDFVESERRTLDFQHTVPVGEAHTLMGGVYL